MKNCSGACGRAAAKSAPLLSWAKSRWFTKSSLNFTAFAVSSATQRHRRAAQAAGAPGVALLLLPSSPANLALPLRLLSLGNHPVMFCGVGIISKLDRCQRSTSGPTRLAA